MSGSSSTTSTRLIKGSVSGRDRRCGRTGKDGHIGPAEQFCDFATIMQTDLSGFASSAQRRGLVMIDPIVAISLVVAFAIALVAILLTRRAPERTLEEHTEETEQRYVNGGWR
jgi:hypothetical protein